MILLFSIISCRTGEKQATQNEQMNKEFENFSSYFIEELWRLNPDWAIYEGFYKYDTVLQLPDEDNRSSRRKAYLTLKDSLNKYNPDELPPLNAIDYYLIRDHIESSLWYIEKYRSYEWNPAVYSIGGSFDNIIRSNYKPLNEKLRAIYQRMKFIPEYYQVARENLKNPTIPHTDLGITQVRGSAYVFDNTLTDSLNSSTLPEVEKEQIRERLKEASKAIQDFADYLQNDIRPVLKQENSRNYRLGEELYEEKFRFDIQSALSARELFEKAVSQKDTIHSQMLKIADVLWKKYFPSIEQPMGLSAVAQLIDTIANNHVHRDSFITAIRQQIPVLERFVREKDLVTLDPDKPLVVRETPPYMRGIAGASISSPGPYEKDAETFYNVTPLDHYTPAQAESYLREYNNYILQILNIHEAIPGHYTQLVYANKSPSLIKSILGNTAMIEGWAVYTERMMLEEGYGNNEPEMWLMYNKWSLRVVCNTILDYSVHVNGMTEEEAMNLLMNEAFQERSEAQEKWKRVQRTQVQLTSYFAGFAEIMDLRNELKQQQGKNFNLKSFHEKFLSYGSAPVKYIRVMMLKIN
jgi:uncharacterized protein (DUF885 family)